ncbi:MAG: ThiF family adenylyltransferase [Phycisphaeraceae bacterium]
MTIQPNLTVLDRDLRQRDLVPPDLLSTYRCTVIGVGAIGRQVALQLAAIGVPSLQLIDFDTVEPVNLAAQGYLQDDLGRPKVHATAGLCQEIHHALATDEIKDRFKRTQTVGDAVFACVDCIQTRGRIFESVKDKCRFFTDGRMSAEVIRILTCSSSHGGWDHYPRTLFSPDEAYAGACTAKSTIFTANIAAGLMLEQFSKHLRGLPIDHDVQLNLLSTELIVHDLHPVA